MSTRYVPALAVLVLLAAAAPVTAQFNSPTLLFDTPTADVLPPGSIAISADVTVPLTKTDQNVDWPEADAHVRFSPFRGFDFGATAYTLKDYVLDAKYQLVRGGPGRFGLAVGLCDVGLHSYVSPIGHDSAKAWPDWKYHDPDNGDYIRPTENFSAFAVASIPLWSFARIHAGLGRGRFVGYDGPNEYMNTDIFFEDYNQWAVSVFGGIEIYVAPEVALVAEANSRDMNAGIKANFGPISAAAAWKKMEGLLLVREGAEGHEFGRLELGVSYLLDFHRPVPPSAPTKPTPLPEPEQPPVVAPIPVKPRLNPIWFKWDKWDITPVAEATLHQNADVLLAHPDLRVLVAGYASEEGSLEHNYPLSARRAYAAYEFLQSLGVPARQMRYRAMGESAGRPLPMHRSVYFKTKPEE
jgi:outer membrane protein OmpA-like peptidoglycan-associated protein